MAVFGQYIELSCRICGGKGRIVIDGHGHAIPAWARKLEAQSARRRTSEQLRERWRVTLDQLAQ